jgi:hypothetical protein
MSDTPHTAFSIRTQSVLYNTPLEAIARSLEYYDNAARLAEAAGVVRGLVVAYGDCSPQPTIDTGALDELRRGFPHIEKIEYVFFGENLGSAAGHNRLLADAAGDLLMTANPDILVAPTMYLELIAALQRRPDIGLAEARQLPIEHPKYYDPATGETSWGSTACLIGATALFLRLGGFDADTFFLYCDDVDFCWRARLAGFRVVHQPSAVVFHDKRLNDNGGWMPSAAERQYSAEAALLLPYKYFRSDLTDRYLDTFRRSQQEDLLKAVEAFQDRKTTGRLPAQIDQDHAVGQFIDDGYAPWRYKPH